MASYGYGPPPPPPPQVTPSGSADAYGRGSGLQRRGSRSHGQGRGMQGQHHAASRHDHHPPPLRYEYAPQPYAPHHPHTAPSFALVTGQGYAHQPSHWGADHGRVRGPMPPASYPPAYPHQSYPPTHYNPPQHTPYAPPQHYPYGAPPPPNPSQWNGPGHPHHVGGQARGGYHDRGPRHPTTAGRYDRNRSSGGGYSHPHSSDRNSQPQHYSYGAPPVPRSGPNHKESHHGQNPRRHRGGHREGGNRGRGGHHGDRRQNNKHNHNTPQQHKNDASSGKKKKRRTNTLGLTPGNESESDDDEGEEQALSNLLGEETMRIGDVAAFLLERRKNYPTKARVAAKKAAVQAQRKESQTASLEKEADKLRRQLRKVESSIKRKREQGDEGDEMRGTSDNSSDDAPPESISSKAASATIPSRPALVASGKRADITRHCKYYSTGGTCGKKDKCRFVHDPEIREAAIKEREANNGHMTIQQRLILNDKEQEDLTVLRSIQYLRQKGVMSDAEAASAALSIGDKQEAKRDDDGTEKKKEKKNPNTAEKDGGPPLVVSSSSAYRTLPPASASLPPPPPPPRELSPAAKQNSHSSKVAEHETGQGTTTKHYEGWDLRPYGSSAKEGGAAS